METSKIKLRHPDIHLIFKWRFKGGFSRNDGFRKDEGNISFVSLANLAPR
jgi:hypothetical protein